MDWKQYQEEVAELFRSLGFTATVEAQISGVRGVHKIDVHATQATFGFKITWIVECKYWNRAVPKEKVLVLSQIAADVGADRAFLLSESGFQSGAILATKNTNVTLTSLPDLRENTQAELSRIALAQIAQRAYELEDRLHQIFNPRQYRRADGLWEKLLDLLARVFALKTIALPKAQAGDFPVSLYEKDSIYVDRQTFISAARMELVAISNELDGVLVEIAKAPLQVPSLVDAFEACVNEFLDAAQKATSAQSALEHDRGCREALAPMRRIGDKANLLAPLLSHEEHTALRSAMRSLIDGPYLLIAERGTGLEVWAQARKYVAECIGRFKEQVDLSRATEEGGEDLSLNP